MLPPNRHLVRPAPPAQGWRGVARSLLLLLVWSVALVAAACFLLVAPVIERGLLLLPALSDLSLSALVALRALLSASVLFAAIFLTYRVVAGRRVAALRLVLAALLAALGWIGASLGFSRVVPILWGATQLYGTLGSVVLFLIWAYLDSWILLLGGFLLVRPRGASDLTVRAGRPPAPFSPERSGGVAGSG